MKRILLHIGLHKTGTTAVQAFMADNEERFLADHGIRYLRAGRPEQSGASWGHHLLALSSNHSEPNLARIGRGNEWEIAQREMHEAAEDFFVISSENFDRLDEPNVARVRERLAAFRVQVVCYLRRQDEFAQAMYTTDVSYHGVAGSFDEYLPSIGTSLDYASIVAVWRRHFGQDDVLVRIYDRKSLVGANVIPDFLAVLGLAPERSMPGYVWPSPLLNQSIGNPWIDLIRWLRVKGAAEREIRLLIGLAARLGAGGGKRNPVSVQRRRQVLAASTPSNAQLFHELHMENPWDLGHPDVETAFANEEPALMPPLEEALELILRALERKQ